MKRYLVLFLALVCTLSLFGCNNQSMDYIIKNKPSVTGVVEEVHNDYIIMYSETAEGYPNGSEWQISLNVENIDSCTNLTVGDEIVVYHDGNVMETDPLKVGKVYAITLKTPANRTSTDKSISNDTVLQNPPDLIVNCGNESIEALRGTTSWQYDNGNGTFSGINSDSMHPLQAKEFMTPLNIIPTPYSHIDPLMAYLQWDVTPDKVSVRCWSEDCWGQYGDYDDTSEEIEVQKLDIEIAHGSNETQRTADYTIRLKDENYIYEVVAEWNSSDKYFGTAYYSFYTKTFYDIDLDSLTPIPIVEPEAQRTEYVMPDVIEKVHVTFYSMGQTSEWYLEDSKISSWREWAANLSLKPLSEEKVEELQMTEGGESYHFEINDDEVSFTFIDGGTDKYLVIAKTYFEVLNGTVPDVMPEK